MKLSNSAIDVMVVDFDLEDGPAAINVRLRIAGQSFFTRITYTSISSWDEVWKAAPALDPDLLLGTIVAWDLMRFMALGGETLTLCEGLRVDPEVADLWRTCFLRQYGEWRCRNSFEYSKTAPRIQPVTTGARPIAIGSRLSSQEAAGRVLLANGGGKDTLVGMLILHDAGLDFDVFEGVLPAGGDAATQQSLLEALRIAVAPEAIAVGLCVEDDFYEADASVFDAMGVEVDHFRADFAVGATGNYVGLFPILIAHHYACAYFNIESSADAPDLMWQGEAISHQWCKSTEYRSLMADLFRQLTGRSSFLGFTSTIAGLTDTTIYDLACAEPAKLAVTHSCNLDKPWCGKCPKCCFSYLMMSVRLGEGYARQAMRVSEGLFSDPSAQQAWHDLLEPERIAWECVAPYQECVAAIRKLPPGTVLPDWMHMLAAAARSDDTSYRTVDWAHVPAQLRRPTFARIGKAGAETRTSVAIVGGGQSGLSMSRVLQREGVDHVVIEAVAVGESWRTRWDSFRLNTPNSTLRLADFGYDGNDPDGFSSKEQVREFLEDYARTFDLPVIDRCRVARVSRDGAGFLIETALGTIRSDAIVIATGEYVSPRFPDALVGCSTPLPILHTADYRRPDQLPAGAVLVVGGGQSGAQIVEDLHSAGRKVFWSLSDRPSNTRRLFDIDFMGWWDIGGILHRHVLDIPDVKARVPGALRKARSTEFPLVSGVGPEGLGHAVSPMDLRRDGVTLLARLERLNDVRAHFSPNLNDQLMRAVAGTRAEYEMLSGFADDHFGGSERPDLDRRFIPSEVLEEFEPVISHVELDLGAVGITSIVVATGFASAWPWLEIPDLLDADGYPLGEDGISPSPGLYFVGLFNLQRLSSTCLCNGGRDAERLTPAIVAYLSELDGSAAPVRRKAAAR